MLQVLLHRLQRILLWICQYNIRILYEPGPQLFIANWLFMHNLKTNRDEEIPDMCVTFNAIESCTYMPECLTAEEIREVILDDEHLSGFAELILCDWPSIRNEVHKELQPYWSFRDEIAFLDGFTIKRRRILIPTLLHDKAINQ